MPSLEKRRKYIDVCFVVVSCIASALLVLSCLPRFVKPQEFCIIEFISIGISTYFCVQIILLIVWLWKRRFVMSVFISAALLCSLFVLSDVFAHSFCSVRRPERQCIKVLSYNVQAFARDGWAGRPAVCKGIFGYLQEQEPDVICIQEFHHDQHETYVLFDSIRTKMGLSNVYVYKEHSLKDYYFYGTVVFSRFPIVKCGTLRYQDTGNNSVWVDVVAGRDTIRVYNSHLESYRFGGDILLDSINNHTAKKSVLTKIVTSLILRGLQADTLAEHMRRCPYKMLCCGDFNSPPDSYVYQRIRHSCGLRDAFLETGWGIGGTLNWKLPSKRIDYVLYSPGLSAVKFERRKVYFSDHFPVCAVIELDK